MSTSSPTPLTFPAMALPMDWKINDLQAHLGGIPLERIRMFPPPGMATEDDVLRLRDHEGILCELIDGVLVEKTMGSYESAVAVITIQLLAPYLAEHPIGILLGADGMLRLQPKRIRIPDVSFLSWGRFPGRKRPAGRVWSLVPDLVVEVLSDNNTEEEIEQKLDEYFAAGTSVAWIIAPQRKSARLYTARDQFTEIDEQGELVAEKVLPGFSLKLKQIFAALPEE